MLRCWLNMAVLMFVQSVLPAAFPEVQLRNVPNTGRCIQPLQELAAKVVAENLYRCKDGTVARELAILPGTIQRLPQSYFIDRVLTDRIGRREKKLNIAPDERQERTLAAGLKLACGDSGKKLFTGSADGGVRLWDIEDGSMKTFYYHGLGVTCVTCTPDDSQVFSASYGPSVRAFDVSNLKGMLISRGHYASLACSQNGTELFAIDQAGSCLRELIQDKELLTFEHRYPGTKMTVIASGEWIFLGGYKLRLYNPQSDLVAKVGSLPIEYGYKSGIGVFIGTSQVKHPVELELSLACSSKDGGLLFWTAEDSSKLFVEVRSGRPGRSDWYTRRYGARLSYDVIFTALACSADGTRVFLGTDEGSIYEVRKEDEFYRKPYFIGNASTGDDPRGIYELVCNADGSRLFSASPGLLALWTDYLQDLNMLDTDILQLLFQTAQVWHETDKPLLIDLQDDRWRGLLSRCPYLQHEKLFVRPA